MSDLVIDAEKKIKQTRLKLINKARKRGVWENFGNKERRELEDQFLFKGNSFEETQKLNQMIFEFDEWCSQINCFLGE